MPNNRYQGPISPRIGVWLFPLGRNLPHPDNPAYEELGESNDRSYLCVRSNGALRLQKNAHARSKLRTPCRRTRSRLNCCQIGNDLLMDNTKVWCFYDLRNGSNVDYSDVYFVPKQKWR